MIMLLVPGFWLDGTSWDAVAPALREAGHTVVALTLPGLTGADPDPAAVTLADQVAAVVAVIDEHAAGGQQVVLVGHSGGSAVVQAAVDARVSKVARVIHVDALPAGPGGCINADLPVVDGLIPLPDWSVFDESSLVGLDEPAREQFRARAIPTPARVASDPQQLRDEGRFDVPATLITCEIPSEVVHQLMSQGHPYAAELARVRDVTVVDLPTGHWPQFSRPSDLAAAILSAINLD